MIVSWMLYALLVSVLLAAGARALEEVCRLGGLATRFLWIGALIAMLALVASAPLRRVAAEASAESAIELAALSAAPGANVTVPASFAPPADLRGAMRAVLGWPLRTAATWADGRTGGALAVGWLVLSLSLLALGIATLVRYRRARRRWPLRQVAGVGVRVAPTSGPAVVGLLRPEIVVPEWLLDAPPEEQRLVVLHEREHLRSRDSLVLAVGCLSVILLPWNPVAWWMLLRLRLAVELDCDTRVLRAGVRPQAYGALLIDMAGRRAGLPLGMAAFAGSPSTLERRLLTMTRRLPRFALVRTAALSVLGSATLLAACETRMPTAAEVETMDVAAVETQAQRLRLVTPEEGNVIYMVDGVQVSAEEARALAGDRIAKLEVLRASPADGRQIRITTRSGEDAGEISELAEKIMRDLPPADGERQVHVLRVQRREGEGATMILPGGEFEGLLLLDGVPAQASALRGVRPDQIERVEVLKGDAATRQFDDPRAANGVIRITTKGTATSR
ncbi:MAG TPA: M56 family metallopeptidase [Longimicrobiaceae bacterium]|nr:M56 family metallopeptidase [Longimicrobiaceae bacterium]